MKRALTVLAILLGSVSSPAFSSAKWLAECADTADMVRLQAAWSNCSARAVSPAKNVVFPLENFADGRVKSRLAAREAYLFMDTGFIWGKGIRVEQYAADGKTVNGWIEAENCVVDRNSRTGWVEGLATMDYGKAVVKGRGVYFSVPREYVKICSQSEIRLSDVTFDPKGLLK